MAIPVHVLVCWNHRYNEIATDAIEQHESMIHKSGYAWWGKFYKENDNRAFTQLEPAEQPMNGDENYLDFINRQIANGIPTKLFVLNPNPGHVALWMVDLNLAKFKMFGDVPPDSTWYKHVPHYYFKDNKPGTRQDDLKFLCRHWFKISGDFAEPGLRALDQLFDVNEGRRVSFSRANIYPMLVAHEKDWTGSKEAEKLGSGLIRSYVDYEFAFIKDPNRSRACRCRWREAQEQFRLGKYRHAVQDVASIVEFLLEQECACRHSISDGLNKIIKEAIAKGCLDETSGIEAQKIRDLRNRVHLAKDMGTSVTRGEAASVLDGFGLIYKSIGDHLARRGSGLVF